MPSSSELISVLGWFAVAAVVALGGFFIAAAVRRWTQRDEPAATFTFQDLRDMRARGDITAREFAIMRAALLSELGLEHGDDDEKPPESDEPEAPAD